MGADSDGIQVLLGVLTLREVASLIERRRAGSRPRPFVFEANNLAAMNPFLNDFHQLLIGRIGLISVAFTSKEILMFFSNEIPAALSRLQQVVDGRARSQHGL